MKNITIPIALPFFIFLLSLTGCKDGAKAVSTIKPTSAASQSEGKATLQETSEGLYIIAELKNLTPGLHGFHIHEKGDCADEGKAAGSHFNPDQTPHGHVTKDGFTHSHAGDFGNVEADQNGNAKFEGLIKGLTLKEGEKYGVLGRSFIVHEKADDFGQPLGNAGGRVACGIIENAEN